MLCPAAVSERLENSSRVKSLAFFRPPSFLPEPYPFLPIFHLCRRTAMLQLRGAQLVELDLLSCGMLWISTWAGVDYPKTRLPHATEKQTQLRIGRGEPHQNPISKIEQTYTLQAGAAEAKQNPLPQK